jgi:hypothetical protein
MDMRNTPSEHQKGLKSQQEARTLCVDLYISRIIDKKHIFRALMDGWFAETYK